MTEPEHPKRPRGRPRKYGKRHKFPFRITQQLRARLIASAMASGRSCNEEIEFRIDRDFNREDCRLNKIEPQEPRP